MAWKPTQNQISVYEDILKKYQKLRRQIVKAHKNLESVTPSGRMPAMVVPQRERKMSMRQIRITGRRAFALKMKQLKKIVHGGLQAFYNDYKKSYLFLYREYILPEYPMGGYSEAKGMGHYYTDEQIAECERLEGKEMAQFMRDYNRIVFMNGTVFTLLLKSGKIPEFKYIYRQFASDIDMYENYAQAFHKGLSFANRINARTAENILSGANFSKRSRETMSFFKKAFELEQTLKDK